ncbi:HAMP domain-containing protein [Loktanella atrilutea]|uniref:HAMP domain-containing protein n=1 Tax=Loktanella atrilutea TaxID=366533 RepID=A0A1M5EZU4_LOKAT|nr:cache domain-containing protein [Loktanella atrilutea]SHF84739.1 HAMP domain-containing protein [Loktanella atrilutea]
MPNSPTYTQLTLTRAVYGFVAVGIFLVGLSTAFLLFTKSSTMLDGALDTAVRVRASSAGQNLAQSLHTDWRNLKSLTQNIPSSDPQRITGMMDGMRGDGSRISWIGFADVNGKVLDASDGLLVGADVSERPWFRNGLQAPYAGDVHKAVLLAKILSPDAPSDLRFVDLAMPVIDETGQRLGVVGVHINFAWAEAYLREQAEALGLMLYLASADGQIIMASDDEIPNVDELQILRSSMSGADLDGREVWPDGKTYFSSLVPSILYADLPNFGWRLVGRLDGSLFGGSVAAVKGQWMILIANLLVVMALLTAVFVRVFISPIATLGQSAEDIAEGKDIYPPDLSRTKEMAQLSASLARMQVLKSR